MLQVDISQRFTSNSYQLIDKIGQGGFGSVFRAKKLATDQIVAIKFLNFNAELETQKSQNYIDRFHREASLSSLLQHPNIVRLLDKGICDQGLIYTVFEYVQGHSLKDVLQREVLSPAVVVSIMGQILDALDHAHNRGVIHRDLKPANIMLNKTSGGYHVKILDFGIATLTYEARLQDYKTITLTNEALGTPAYCSPEQLRGEPPTTKSDFYVWGLVFIECLTGSPAISGSSLAAIFHKQLSKQHVFIPSSLIGHPISNLLRRVLQKKSQDRFSGAPEIILELNKLNVNSLVGDLRNGPLTQTTEYSNLQESNDLDETQVNTSFAFHSKIVERKQLSVLSVSLTVLSNYERKVDSEIAEALFNDQLSSIQDLAIGNGAYHVGTLGDTQLFYFGYPTISDSDVRLCARTALDLISHIKERNILLEDRYGVNVNLQLGINTGLATFYPDTAPVGETVNIAMKLARHAGPQEIFCSGPAKKALETTIEFLPSKVLSLNKGLHSLDAYKLVGELSEQGYEFFKTKNATSKLSGRKNEVNSLLHFLEKENPSSTIAIEGEAGIGKSRLIYDVIERVNCENYAVGRCLPEHRYKGLFPILSILRERFSLDVIDDEKAYSTLKSALIGVGGTNVHVSMPILCSWLNIDYNNVISISDLSIKLQKQHLFNSLLALITFNERDISEAPMLLVVEDIHWADATTIEFIDFLMSKAAVRKTKCKVILSSRFSSSQRFTSNDLIELKLKCLTVAESSILVEELFYHEKLSGRLLYEITSRTGGVPYFIEELISMLMSEGLVKILNGCADFVADVNISAVPDTLRGSLQQKIERLKHSKDTAQLSSVIGREFSLELLALVSRKPKQQLNNDLKELVNKGVIYKKRLTYADVYVFKHALVKDAVYESILESMRIVFHKQVASILLESFDHEVMKSPAVLARHWELAECSSLSANWYLKAAKRSEEKFFLEESIVYFNKVLSLFNENGVGEDSEKYFDPYFGLGNAYENIGEYKKSRLNYQKSISTGGVDIGKVTAYLKLGKTWEVTHQFKLALEEYEQAEFVLKSLGLDEHGDIWIDEWLKIQSAKLGVNYWRGNIENMNGYIEKIESLVMARGNAQQKSRYFTDILQLSVRRKRYRLDPDDTEIAKKSLSYANQTNDISLQAFGCFALGFTLYFNDLFLESIAELEYGLVKFERSNSVANKCRFTIYMSIAYRRCMDIENTKKYAVTALNLATKAARQDYVAAANANLAWVAYKSNEDIKSMELIKLSKHLWESIKDEYPFPFQWLSLIIELELLVNNNIKKGGWQDEIVRIATALMSESQQILPALINENLETFLCCYSKKGVFIKSYLIDSLKEAKRTTFL